MLLFFFVGHPKPITYRMCISVVYVTPLCGCVVCGQFRASLDPRTIHRAGDLEFHVASLAVDLEDPTVLLVCVMLCWICDEGS